MVIQSICAGKMQSFVWSRCSWALHTTAPTSGKKPSSQHIHFSTSGCLYGCLFFHSCVQIVWVFSWIQKLSKISDTCLFSSNIKSWASWFLLLKKVFFNKSSLFARDGQNFPGGRGGKKITNHLKCNSGYELVSKWTSLQIEQNCFLEDQTIKSRDSSKVLKP